MKLYQSSKNRYYSQQAITLFPLSHSQNINLPETRRTSHFFKYRAHHQHFVLTIGYFNWKIYDQIYLRYQEPGWVFRYFWVLHRVNIDTCTCP
jgi:hypothetical protein